MNVTNGLLAGLLDLDIAVTEGHALEVVHGLPALGLQVEAEHDPAWMRVPGLVGTLPEERGGRRIGKPSTAGALKVCGAGLEVDALDQEGSVLLAIDRELVLVLVVAGHSDLGISQ